MLPPIIGGSNNRSLCIKEGLCEWFAAGGTGDTDELGYIEIWQIQFVILLVGNLKHELRCDIE